MIGDLRLQTNQVWFHLNSVILIRSQLVSRNSMISTKNSVFSRWKTFLNRQTTQLKLLKMYPKSTVVQFQWQRMNLFQALDPNYSQLHSSSIHKPQTKYNLTTSSNPLIQIKAVQMNFLIPQTRCCMQNLSGKAMLRIKPTLNKWREILVLTVPAMKRL